MDLDWLSSCSQAESLPGALADHVDWDGTLEAVEGRRGSASVRPHVLIKHPVSHIQHSHHLLVLDLIERIARRAPDGRGEQLAGLIEEGSSGGMGMVEKNAVEAPVHAVVDVVHVAGGRRVAGVLGDLLGGHGGVRDHVRHESEGARREESARLGDKADVRLWEELAHGRADEGSDLLEGGMVLSSGESSAHVNNLHLVTERQPDVEEIPGVLERDAVRRRVVAAGAHVEANADHGDAQLSSALEQFGSGLEWLGAELEVERAGGRGIGDGDAEDQLRALVVLGDLLQLLGVVEGHHGDALLLGVRDEGAGLAWIGVDDALRRHAHAHHDIDLLTGGAVESDAKRRQGLDHRLITVALDSVEGLDLGQLSLPESEALVERVQVDDHEGLIVVLQGFGIGDGSRDGQHVHGLLGHVHLGIANDLLAHEHHGCFRVGSGGNS
ncbi:hypothetical protein PENTCL1PPCAC_1397 [Pristionchus entomophagus]|uniref:Ribosomal protein n=1 Tax=Pristionchus entomophagus TaxID=358040 RepID=A0AAV5S9P8_9BILA|nr:hypothetical protein PENTCL1PPCAC_1397 [Pristionchus entomophagus]